jgi:hypothetical protein
VSKYVFISYKNKNVLKYKIGILKRTNYLHTTILSVKSKILNFLPSL